MAHPQIPAPQQILMPVVEEWLQARFVNSVGAATRYEHSIYGPLTSYLHAFFPSNRRFMVKPQGMLRPQRALDLFEEVGQGFNLTLNMDYSVEIDPKQGILDEDEEDNDELKKLSEKVDEVADEYQEIDEGDTYFDELSVDSYGHPVPSRNVPGSNNGVKFPDFVVVKASDTLTDDTLLLIVEVKISDNSRSLASLQIMDYLMKAASRRRDPLLKGLLIQGNKTAVFQLGPDGQPQQRSGRRFNTGGDGFGKFLHSTAVRNWAM